MLSGISHMHCIRMTMEAFVKVTSLLERGRVYEPPYGLFVIQSLLVYVNRREREQKRRRAHVPKEAREHGRSRPGEEDATP